MLFYDSFINSVDRDKFLADYDPSDRNGLFTRKK